MTIPLQKSGQLPVQVYPSEPLLFSSQRVYENVDQSELEQRLVDLARTSPTEESWTILTQLQQKQFKFIVIGGWAAYLWTRSHKSKDIDIIVADFKDLEYLKKEYDLRKKL